MKLCKDCRYYRASTPSDPMGTFAKCLHKEFIHTSAVTGAAMYERCAEARKSLCGKEAILFEERTL